VLLSNGRSKNDRVAEMVQPDCERIYPKAFDMKELSKTVQQALRKQ
jgi:hypothetical protein